MNGLLLEINIIEENNAAFYVISIGTVLREFFSMKLLTISELPL